MIPVFIIHLKWHIHVEAVLFIRTESGIMKTKLYSSLCIALGRPMPKEA
jgi:hypothetical protein